MMDPSLNPSARATAVAVEAEAAGWHDVCALDDIPPDSARAALIAGEQIAIVRTRGGALAALCNFDPFSQAFVIARGMVGDRAGVAKIVSPMHKHSFALETGQCLDDPAVRLQTFAVRVVGGRILVAVGAAAGDR
jgi:nitrite reductase (NADH) small subunit